MQRADDLFEDFALLPASAPAPVGNKREAVPKTADDAAARFRCATLGCDMQGASCAAYWRSAEDGATNRPSCRGCPAGRARESLLRGVEPRRVPPPVGIPEPKPRASKCRRCGMLRDRKHTEAACRIASERIADADMARRQAAVDRAQRRKAEAEAERRRQRAEAADRRAKRADERRASIAAVVAALESGAPVPACEAPILRAAKDRVRAATAPERNAARAKRAADAAAAADERARAVAAGIEAIETATGRNADGKCMRAGGCQRRAARSYVGPFCSKCMASARETLHMRRGSDPGPLRAWLLDPTRRAAMNGMRIDWSGVDWSLPNAEIARSLGCVPASVRIARRRLGAPESPMRGNTKLMIDWGSVDLGQRPDADIAAALGVPAHAVAEARRARGIRAVKPRETRWRVLVAAITAAGLGVASDAEIARALRIARRIVTRVRNGLGIPPPPRRHTKPAPLDGVDWDAVGLGVIPDERIAIALGVSPTTVRKHRIARGLPTAAAPAGRPDIEWEALDWANLSDRAIGSMVGVDPRAVLKMREKLGKPRPAHAVRRSRHGGGK